VSTFILHAYSTVHTHIQRNEKVTYAVDLKRLQKGGDIGIGKTPGER